MEVYQGVNIVIRYHTHAFCPIQKVSFDANTTVNQVASHDHHPVFFGQQM